MVPRVFLLEDDAVLRDHVLIPALRKFGFGVMGTGCGKELDDLLLRQTPDIFVLDVALPDCDGFDVAARLRDMYPQLGVVMLTGHAARTDVLRGLSEGADAYLTKPVDIDILVATLLGIMRRLNSRARAGKFSWQLGGDGWIAVSPSGGRVRLTSMERQLLTVLMSKRNEVHLCDELIAAVAEDAADFDAYRLDTLIHQLHRKVLRTLGEPLPLKPVHGEGYVFVDERSLL